MIKFPSNETVAILNEGDIELNTGNIPNAKVIMTAPSVETTGDVFVKGSAEGISAQLASLKSRLQSAEDEITTIKTEIASLDATNGYVDVEQIRFTNEDATITHTASSGTPILTISSTNGPVSVVSDAQYVDVESVRLTDSKIGTTNDADLITLADDAVTVAGVLQVSDDFKLSEISAAITHTAGTVGATTGLTISSTAGFVDVESVRFTETKIGITGDTDIITLSSASVAVAGALGSTGDFNVATTAFTVAAASGDTAVGGTLSVTGESALAGAASLSSTLDVGGATTLTSSLDVGSDFKVAETKFTVDSIRPVTPRLLVLLKCKVQPLRFRAVLASMELQQYQTTSP